MSEPRGCSRAAEECGRSRAQAGRHGRRRVGRARSFRSRSRRTATPPFVGGPGTTTMSVPPGCSRARRACGRSRAESWRQRGRRAPGQVSVAISGDGNTAIVGGSIVDDSGRRRRRLGVHAQRGGVDAARRQAGGTGLHRRRRAGPSRWRSRAMATPPSSAGPDDSSIRWARRGCTREREGVDAAGSELVGTGAVGGRRQGFSVAISGDGNTTIVGGIRDDAEAGAAWVFTRTGSAWTQQGDKLVGSGAVGAARQGSCDDLEGMGTPPSSAGPTTTPASAPRGCSRAAGECGRNRATSWSARVPSGPPSRANRWRSRRTAPRRSSAGRVTTPSVGAAWVFTAPTLARPGCRWRATRAASTTASGGATSACSTRARRRPTCRSSSTAAAAS